LEFLKWLVGPSGFMPHGYCYRWVPGLVWLHGISDSLIFLSYMSIPVTLMYIVRRRKDLPFNWIFVCFGIFIVACGLTHAMEVWNLWHAMYWLAGLIKAVTAAASVATAVLLVRLVPQAVGIPSAGDLKEAHVRLIRQEAALSASEEKFRALLEAEAKYSALLEAAPDAMVVVNQAGEIVLLNLQAEKQFGYNRDELLGQQVKNIIPEGFAERLITDRTRTAADALAQQIGTGIELSARRKDGSEFPIEIMLSPLEDAEGILVTAAIRDITVRKTAEEALRQSEERLRLVVSNAMDYSILMLDLDGRVVSWNEGAERIKGYRAEEIIGQNFSRFYVAEDVSNGKPAQELAQATTNGRSEDEGWRVRKDGSRFYANVVITALYDETGRLRGFGKITRDITERKRSEERLVKTAKDLKRSNDQLQQFAYVASHDLQEPLRMVASYTQLLARRYQGRLDSDADEFIAYAVDGCNRMQGLILDLLAYSRSGTERKLLREISGETALQEVLANLRVSIEESGATVTHDLLPTLTTDDTQLVQVLQNLIGNAIKYRGAAAPQVHVSAMKKGGKEWIFSVRDNGLGISPQYFERIFIIFQRLHGQHEFNGTGIGLAICKKIVEQSGGRIWVESQLAKGSTFFFSLPESNGN
jgi:PAS domain S-box-containing protein